MVAGCLVGVSDRGRKSLARGLVSNTAEMSGRRLHRPCGAGMSAVNDMGFSEVGSAFCAKTQEDVFV